MNGKYIYIYIYVGRYRYSSSLIYGCLKLGHLLAILILTMVIQQFMDFGADFPNQVGYPVATSTCLNPCKNVREPLVKQHSLDIGIEPTPAKVTPPEIYRGI